VRELLFYLTDVISQLFISVGRVHVLAFSLWGVELKVHSTDSLPSVTYGRPYGERRQIAASTLIKLSNQSIRSCMVVNFMFLGSAFFPRKNVSHTFNYGFSLN
jgi:hypothetical protein